MDLAWCLPLPKQAGETAKVSLVIRTRNESQDIHFEHRRICLVQSIGASSSVYPLAVSEAASDRRAICSTSSFLLLNVLLRVTWNAATHYSQFGKLLQFQQHHNSRLSTLLCEPEKYSGELIPIVGKKTSNHICLFNDVLTESVRVDRPATNKFAAAAMNSCDD